MPFEKNLDLVSKLIFNFFFEQSSQAFAGDICAFFGLDCASGDSFVLDKSQTLSMESIHVPDPVISMSIKPKDKKHADNFAKAVARFTKEDPTYKVCTALFCARF